MGKKKLPDEEKLRELYVGEGMSLEEIGDLYDVTRGGVAGAFKRNGIPTRSKSEARLLALQKGKLSNYHEFNRDFFKEWSPEVAYVLGLIYADGYVGEGHIQFVFGRKSKELLCKLGELMESNKNPVEFDNNGYPAWRLTFSSKEMIRDINRLGLPSGPKSLTKTFPKHIPLYLEQHFIRGYFDGNGSVTVEGGLIRFHTGSRDFAEGISNRIYACMIREFGSAPTGGRVYDYSGKTSTLPGGREITRRADISVIYASNQDTQRLYKWLYGGVPGNQYLERKKTAWEELIQWKNWGKTIERV